MFFKMRSAYFVAAISTVLTVAAVASAKYKAHDPKIQVHAKGPAGMSIDGVSTTLKIEQDDKFYKFKTYLNTIDTKNSKRNDHMQERLEAKKYGSIVLSVPASQVDAKKSGSFKGQLMFHGKEKDVDGDLFGQRQAHSRHLRLRRDEARRQRRGLVLRAEDQVDLCQDARRCRSRFRPQGRRLRFGKHALRTVSSDSELTVAGGARARLSCGASERFDRVAE